MHYLNDYVEIIKKFNNLEEPNLQDYIRASKAMNEINRIKRELAEISMLLSINTKTKLAEELAALVEEVA